MKRDLLSRVPPEQARSITLLVIMVLCSLFVAHLSFVHDPAASAARSAQSRIPELRQSYNEAVLEQAQLEESEKKLRRRLKSVREQLNQLKLSEASVGKRLVATNDLPRVESTFSNLAGNAGLRLQNLTKHRKEVRNGDLVAATFHRTRYTLTLIGSFVGTGRFLSQLEDLPWPVSVSTYDMDRTQGNAAGLTLTVELDILTPREGVHIRTAPLAAPQTLAAINLNPVFQESPAPDEPAPITPETVVWEEYTLTGMMGSHDRQVAIINGQIVSVGSTLGNATVERIANGTVVLRQANETRTLQLPERAAAP